MDQYILGISSFYHDSAAAIIKNGEIIAAAQEERFSRKKHDPRFPHNAINYCLSEAFIEPEDISLVVFYDHPILTFDRLLHNFIASGNEAAGQFGEALKASLGTKWWVKDNVRKALGENFPDQNILFCAHHMSHAASAFYPTPFEDAAIITVDGVGEWQTTTISHGKGNRITMLKEINYPHSLGLLYSAFTYYCGFKINSGEYKLMGLAPYGQPIYADIIRNELIDIKEDGSYRLNMKYFTFMESSKTIGKDFEDLFGQPAREPESRITRHTQDIAASIQAVTEEIMIRLAQTAKKLTGSENICLAGGVALNCVANGKIARERIFKNMWIQPASGDAGGALGAALFGWFGHLGQPRIAPVSGDSLKGSYLGPSFSAHEIQAFLDRNAFPYKKYDSLAIRNKHIAEAMAKGSVVGYFHGRMEFGPRSLGARSIIGDARNPMMQSKMNLKIKFRESFRPFAPAVKEEDAVAYFDLEGPSPYMLIVAPVNERLLKRVDENLEHEDMIEIVNQERSDIPAVTHVDYSARVQTVSSKTKPDFYGLIDAFKQLTGSSVIVNTSFNVRGEPIVCSPKEAYTCFMRTGMDLLVLEDYVLVKTEQPEYADKEDWTSQYELD
jgi:carbamoyltransferase